MTTRLLARRSKLSTLALLALPLATLLPVACTGDDVEDEPGKGGGGSGGKGKGGTSGSANTAATSGSSEGGSNAEGGVGGAMGGEGFGGAMGGEGFGGAGQYEGPSVGRAKTFAVLAYSAITTSNVSEIVGELGVSAGALSKIKGFDAPTYTKYATDSLAPHNQRSRLAQQDVTALVNDIDPRPCDQDLTDVVGGLTGDITLQPGVTCMNSFTADVIVNGQVTLDAGHDPNAYFVIRGNMSLTVADGAEVVLKNGAQACGVFWRISKEVIMGTTVKFIGTVVSGSAITMKSNSTLSGRALAQTEGVQLDANSIIIPAACTHVQ